jgi:hypothetical protein
LWHEKDFTIRQRSRNRRPKANTNVTGSFRETKVADEIPSPSSDHPPKPNGPLFIFSISLHKPLRDAQYYEALIPMLLRHLVFEVVPQEDGTWIAVGIGDDIFTQGSDFEDLKVNALEAVRAHFYDENLCLPLEHPT